MGNQSIVSAVNMIIDDDLVLPALQRDFVWKPEQIENLFDSLLRGYPIGNFLYWEIQKEKTKDYIFHKFSSDINYVDKSLRRDPFQPQGSVKSVLDGQQRLTCFYIALKGSITTNVPKRLKVNGKNPPRFLALDLLYTPKEEDEDRNKYRFKFLTEKEFIHTNDEYWFKVADALNIENEPTVLNSYIEHIPEIEVSNKFHATSTLSTLVTKIHKEDVINFYTETKSLSEAVRIFERLNNYGSKVSGTDIMLSTASIAKDKDGKPMDIYEMLSDAITTVKNATNSDTGFVPDRNFILTAMLMATDAERLSITCQDNYKKDRISKITKNWDDIIKAIVKAGVLIDSLGLNGKTIGKSFLYPIVYYFYVGHKKTNINTFCSSTQHKYVDERHKIIEWIVRAKIKKIFDYSTAATLESIRETMFTEMNKARRKSKFPLEALINETSKTLTINTDDVNNLLTLEYGDTLVRPLLTVLFKESKTKAIDHMWPQEKMGSSADVLKAANSSDKKYDLEEKTILFYTKHYNILPNLQTLDSVANSEKSDKYYDKWLNTAYTTTHQRNEYFKVYCIPTDISLEYDNFEEFFYKRQNLLKSKMIEYFNVDTSEDN